MTRQIRNLRAQKAAVRAISSLALFAAILTSARGQTGKDVRALDAARPVEREIAGGQAHYYQVALAAGQYLRALADQRGVDVVLSFVEPGGRKIIEINRPGGVRGVESLSVIAETSGVYQLEVRPAEENASSARYEIKIEELRPATEPDKTRVAAERAFAEGALLDDEESEDSLKKSLEKYEQALALWRSLGDQIEEACALNGIGGVYDGLGDKRKALDYYSRALPLVRAAKDRGKEASVLFNIGSVDRVLGDMQKALDFLNEALALWRETGDRKREAQALNNLGIVYDSTGEKQKALDHYGESLRVSRAIGNLREQGQTLSNIGALYNSLGETEKALDFFNRALPLRRAAKDRAGEAATLTHIGVIYRTSGDVRKAIDFYNQSLSICRETGDRWAEGILLNNLAVAHFNLGQIPKSIDLLNQSLSLRRATGDREGEAYTLTNLGWFHSVRGKHREAMELLDSAIAIFQSVRNLGGEVDALFFAANIDRFRGDLDKARSRMEAALANIETLRAGVVGPQQRASYFAREQKSYESYIDLLMQLDRMRPYEGHAAKALEASERMRARSLIEMLAEARIDIRQGVDESLLASERALQRLLNQKSQAQMRLAEIKHTPEQSSAMAGEIAELTDQFHRVQAQIRVKSPRYSALTRPAPLSLKDIQQSLDADTLLLEYSLGKLRSYLWAVTQTEIKGFELPKRAEVEAAARLVYDLLTARNRREKNETTRQQQARVEGAEAQYKEAAAGLSKMLLAPAAPMLGNKRLLIVADGALQYVPFAALPVVSGQNNKNWPLATDHRPLIVDHEIMSMPSVSALAVLRSELSGRGPAPKLIAALADPVFDKDDPRIRGAQSRRLADSQAALSQSARDVERSAGEVGLVDTGGGLPRLPFTRQEATGIASLVPARDRKLALDFEASKAAAAGAELAQYRIVHFATHGLLNSLHPELSGLVLSLLDKKGMSQDGFLRLHEIYNLKLGADLVVLSACQTGLGKEIKGEGLVGLTRGFMYAGAARVMASLWKVDDEATAELMKRFYAGVIKEGQRPASALRAAQIGLLNQKDWQSPYYWAAFVLQGEWK